MTGSGRDVAYTVRDPAGAGLPVLVHVPHAGTWIPSREREAFLLDDDDLAEELRLMTDHRTDVLAGTSHELGATVVVNRLSRLVVDPERFADGEEEMEQVGMGFAYDRTAHGRPLRHLDDADRARLRRRWFDPYSDAVAVATRQLVEAHGRCIVIDVHSYPAQRLPYERHGDGPRPELCLGTDPDHTPAWLAEGVVRLCADRGVWVERDTPFAGVYIPSWAYRQDERVQGVMLEIRRDTYMYEHSLEPHDGEPRVRRLVEDVVSLAGSAATSPT